VKSSKSSGFSRPFESLQALLESKSLSLPQDRAVQPSAAVAGSLDDQVLFQQAMAGVKKLPRNNYVERSLEKPTVSADIQDEESVILLQLEELVKHGKGFTVSFTPEYVEGQVHEACPDLTDRLHRGDFSIQGHVDLHGLNVDDARRTLEDFLKNQIALGKRALLIIHGRGLSSPDKPVLKTKVQQWLSSGPWRKWVMAYTSARLCDGGTGATYVLLRQRPLTKRLRKRRRRVDSSKTLSIIPKKTIDRSVRQY
jgi:DNA-nicking Smr family endonuclease